MTSQPQSPDHSRPRFGSFRSTSKSWRLTLSTCTSLLLAPLAASAAGDVVLNEVMAVNQTSALNGGKYPDWVELYNPGDQGIDLGGYGLSDDPKIPAKYTFATGTILAAKGYLVVWCDSSFDAPGLHTGFTLPAEGLTVALSLPASKGSVIKDAITFGPQLPDLTIGRVPTGTGAWQLNVPTPGTANQAQATVAPTALKVNEWMASPVSGEDWFELHNGGAGPVALGGLLLTDSLNNPGLSPIPPLSYIPAGGFLKFDADQATNKGALHANFKLSAGGESIGLFDANRVVINSVTFTQQTEGISQGRLPDGGSTLVSFPATPTPGRANYLPLTNVWINEALTHTDLPLEDAIEFYNPTGTPLNVGGWYLSNSENNLKKFRIPDGFVIPALGYRVIYEYQFNPVPGVSPSFTFNSAHGDEAHLSAADAAGNLTGYKTSVSFGAAENGVSFGRYQTSTGVEFVAMSERSFGRDNEPFVVDFRRGNGLPNPAPKIGPVVINEIMYHPPETISGTNRLDNVLDEYIELVNITDSTVNLHDPLYPDNTWQVDGDVQYAFPSATTFAPGGVLLLVNFNPVQDTAQLAAFRAKYSVSTGASLFGPYKGKLSNSGGSIELYKPDPPQLPPHPDAGFLPYVLVERVVFSDTAPWPVQPDGTGAALQRKTASAFGNDVANWSSATATPGRNGEVVNETIQISGARLQGNQISFQFMPASGRAYTLEYRDVLGSGAWAKVKDIPATDITGPLVVSDTVQPSQTARFYRITSKSL